VVSENLRDVDAWLFDLGNVVIGINFEHALHHWARAADRDVGDLRQRFHFDEAYERHERGQIEAAQYFESLRSLLGLDLADEDLAAGWNAIYTGLIPEVVALLPAMARSRQLYAFTNTNVTHHRAWSAMYARQLQPFEHIFLSCSLGLRKPEAAAFEAIARQTGVPLDRMLFFDDTEENVLGARAAGMPAVWVHSPQDVIDAVVPYIGDEG
jgi:putative hydrolase of the HAD superfamily|tara:strand:- start:81 stop:713 length:633 start_codon:yes stop_codon:yes gene_type:complete